MKELITVMNEKIIMFIMHMNNILMSESGILAYDIEQRMIEHKCNVCTILNDILYYNISYNTSCTNIKHVQSYKYMCNSTRIESQWYPALLLIVSTAQPTLSSFIPVAEPRVCIVWVYISTEITARIWSKLS